MIDDHTPRRRARSQPTEPVDAPDRHVVLRLLLRNPKDLVAGCVAAIAVVAIIGNAMFMQAGPHPAPMFRTAFPAAPVAPASGAAGPLPRPRPSDAETRPDTRAAEAASQAARNAPPPAASSSAAVPRPPASVPGHDPVGDLIASTRRITTVQRVLTEFGYGQLKPTGVAGPETRAAVEKFERERKLPITGQITDRLTHELAAATGRPIE